MGYIHSCTQREKNKYIFPKQKHKLFTMKRRELNDLKVEGQESSEWDKGVQASNYEIN